MKLSVFLGEFKFHVAYRSSIHSNRWGKKEYPNIENICAIYGNFGRVNNAASNSNFLSKILQKEPGIENLTIKNSTLKLKNCTGAELKRGVVFYSLVKAKESSLLDKTGGYMYLNAYISK
ncbi:hypothetical protein BB559_007489, partial [Furculomyces boomerangus]